MFSTLFKGTVFGISGDPQFKICPIHNVTIKNFQQFRTNEISMFFT